MIVILMGVAGSGKTTIAKELIALTGWKYAEGDDYHSEENRRKMHSGVPLTDEDRIPWLESLHEVILGWLQSGDSGVLTCSALKQWYRDILVKDLPAGSFRFVLLEVPVEVLQARMIQRPGHFMNPALLESQLQTLEMPRDALRVGATEEPAVVAAKILIQLKPA